MDEQTLERMDAGNSMNRGGIDACPTGTRLMPPKIDVGDELVLPLNKRVVTQFSTDAAGGKELHLYYGEKEIVFDDPKLFGFGEALAKQERFPAGTATTWGNGYDWPQVSELLEQLIDEGVLQHANSNQCAPAVTEDKYQLSPLPPAPCETPRSWLECKSLTRELTGQAVETGYLEMIIPVFRVAHIAMDADGRQVGEANVFPGPLRVDVPTLWRTCPHTGSRYKSEQPMNVSALKSMRQHWNAMLSVLHIIREYYLHRFPRKRPGLTVGDLERLSTLVLAIPAYLMMRKEGRVANGQLHPVLSSMFRVTDGLRLAMHQMLFIPAIEQTLAPDTTMTGAEIFAYAERNHSFFSQFGVCAGPKAMIDEFLGVLVDGNKVANDTLDTLDPAVQEVLDELDSAFTYGLYGLQVNALVFSLWPTMGRTYERLKAELDAWSGAQSDTFTALRERIAKNMANVQTTDIFSREERRTNSERAYAESYAQCANALDSKAKYGTLEECVISNYAQQCAAAEKRLYSILSRRFGIEGTDDRSLRNVITCLLGYLCKEQAILRAANQIQQRINNLLGRDQPTQAITAAALDIYGQLQESVATVPYLVRELEEVLEMRVQVTRDNIEIIERLVA
jgi:hypothetical protein